MHGTDGEVEHSDGHRYGMRTQAKHYPSRVLLSRVIERPKFLPGDKASAGRSIRNSEENMPGIAPQRAV